MGETAQHLEMSEPRGVRRGKARSFDKAALRILAPFLRRTRRNESARAKVPDDIQKRSIRSKIKDLISKLTSFCKDSLELPTVLRETSEMLKEVTKSEGVASYIVEDSEYIRLNLKYMPDNGRHTVRYKIEQGTTVAAYVAHTQEYIIVEDVLGDIRFPEGVPGNKRCIKSVLCVPVLTSGEGDCIAVIEMYRTIHQKPYTALDLQICISMTGWMGAAIRQNNERLFLLKAGELNNYLASLLEFFFAGTISFLKFVSDIIECSKLSANAERGMLYVMDEEVTEDGEEEITADVYEEGLDSASHHAFKKKNKQRFSKNATGFVVYVARRGKLINIQEAGDDPRFNRLADNYGHLTRSVIGVPIKGSSGVLGVLQLMNKIGGSRFTKHDELLLQKISGYAFMACRHDHLKEQLEKAAYRYEGYEELLRIHIRPCPDDLVQLRNSRIYDMLELPENFFNFEWIITGDEANASKYTVYMFDYLLGDQYFDFQTLTEFVLTVKKSYRDNPYHNFMHAFTVCHCMFNVLHRNMQKFTTLQVFSLLVATLCHDTDHFGFTNNFLEMTKNWLAELYWVSPLEHHHYDVCMLMIQATGLFSRLTNAEVNDAKKMIKSLILSTDLVNIFRTRNHLVNLMKSKSFDWENVEHWDLFLGLVMTVCDVSGQCKPFYAAKKVTEGLYREFYNQGDVEKNLGFAPLTMMDREKVASIPESQIQFLSLICLPSIEILVMVFPNTRELLQHCMELKECWLFIQEKKVIEVWKMEDCILEKKRKAFRKFHVV